MESDKSDKNYLYIIYACTLFQDTFILNGKVSIFRQVQKNNTCDDFIDNIIKFSRVSCKNFNN